MPLMIAVETLKLRPESAVARILGAVAAICLIVTIVAMVTRLFYAICRGE
jgi:hypothetical protein